MGWGRGLINACWEEWRFGGRLLKPQNTTISELITVGEPVSVAN